MSLLLEKSVVSSTSLIELLRSIEQELGGYFQVQETKYQHGVGEDLGKSVSWLDEVESLEGMWFSNRLFPRNCTGRLSADAIPAVRFIRFDMELPDHSQCTDEQAEEVIEFFKSKGARAAIRTPRGVHAYVVTDKALYCEKAGKNTVRDFAHWFLAQGYTGPMVTDMPTWHPSCVSRYVDCLEFLNEGAVVEIPDAVLSVWDAKAQQSVKMGKASLKANPQQAGSLAGRLAVSEALRCYCKAMSVTETAVACGLATNKVEQLWAMYAKPEMVGALGSAGDNDDCFTSLYLGQTSMRRTFGQRTWKFYADRWWGYVDYYSEIGEKRPDLLKQEIMSLPQFALIREKVRKHYKFQTDSQLMNFLIKDIDNHDQYKGGDSLVSDGVLKRVTEVIEALEICGIEFLKTADVCEALPDVSDRHITRALGLLSSKVQHNKKAGPGSGWVMVANAKPAEVEKIDTTASEPVKVEEAPQASACVTTLLNKPAARKPKLPDFDKEIATLLKRLDLDITLIAGPAGSGKTEYLKTEILTKKVTKEGTCVEEEVVVPALIMVQPNEIAIELEQVRLHREVKTLCTGLRLPVIEADDQWETKWETGKHTNSRLIVIDEMTLVSKKLFYQILSRLKPSIPAKVGKRSYKPRVPTRLVVIGDDGQLPPVTDIVGDYPFRDLLKLAEAKKLNIELVPLTGNKRVMKTGCEGLVAGQIAVRAGGVPVEGPGLEIEYVEADPTKEKDEPLSEKLMERGAEVIKERNQWDDPENPGQKQVWRAASSLKGLEYGSQNLADRVVGRKELLPDRIVNGRPVDGDAVICQVTDKQKDIIKGLRGRVTKVEDKYRVRFDRYDEEGTQYHFSRWFYREELVRAEVRNAHTLQGTQADNYVLVLENSRICTREMLYMLLTRARCRVKIVTTRAALRRALATTSPYEVSGWCKEILASC